MNAATHLSPKQQWQTAEYGAAELRDDISDRGSTGEFSDQPNPIVTIGFICDR
jgi:hypothetical protein